MSGRIKENQHGGRRDPEYPIWIMMKQRCMNSKNKDYKNYGERGIKVCDSWIDSYENFIRDLGRRPSRKHTLERRENDKDYCPENCYWTTRDIQARNTRKNRYITYNGKTQTMQDWAKELGMTQATLSCRINDLGWSEEKALSTPPRKINGKTSSYK